MRRFRLILVLALAPAFIEGVVGAATALFANQPSRYGVYIADIQIRSIRYVGNYMVWSVSPDRKWIVGGVESAKGSKFCVYSVATGRTRVLSRSKRDLHSILPNIKWSSDSRIMRVESRFERLPAYHVASGKAVRYSGAMVWGRRDDLGDGEDRYAFGPGKEHSVVSAALSPDKKQVVVKWGVAWFSPEELKGGLYVCRIDGSHLMQVTLDRDVSDLAANKQDSSTDADNRDVVWLNNRRFAFQRTSRDDMGGAAEQMSPEMSRRWW